MALKHKEVEHTIVFPVYNYVVNIVLTNNIIASRNKRVKELGSDFPKEAYINGLHSCNKNERGFSYIFLTPLGGHGTIAHECWHTLWEMFDYVGAEIENEITAYHLSYLIDEIGIFISKNIKKVN